MSDNGLITIPSNHSAAVTIDRLADGVSARGMHVFARIDHAAGAAAAGLPLRPTVLLIFGNPRSGTAGGTVLMQDRQTAGLDLPNRVLAWEDADGKAWLTYNDMAWLARRHGLGAASADAVKALAAATAAAAAQAADA
ncbi:MAG TPA: DUF302 domain-containing protein [Rhizobiaceae bacterium]